LKCTAEKRNGFKLSQHEQAREIIYHLPILQGKAKDNVSEDYSYTSGIGETTEDYENLEQASGGSDGSRRLPRTKERRASEEMLAAEDSNNGGGFSKFWPADVKNEQASNGHGHGLGQVGRYGGYEVPEVSISKAAAAAAEAGFNGAGNFEKYLQKGPEFYR
jgi:hypothetical protein